MQFSPHVSSLFLDECCFVFSSLYYFSIFSFKLNDFFLIKSILNRWFEMGQHAKLFYITWHNLLKSTKH